MVVENNTALSNLYTCNWLFNQYHTENLGRIWYKNEQSHVTNATKLLTELLT